MSQAVPLAPLGPGELLAGRYRLKELLGQGGMGCVFAGEDLRLSRRVAIKVLRDDFDDDSLGERLFREAKAAARVDHPAIVTTYSYGHDEARELEFVVMELLVGETLSQRIARVGPVTLELALHVAREVADALAAVHAAGVVHRDLKPSNVFLAVRGRQVDQIKLLDFGIAKQLDLHTLTATGQVYGTPSYMAPEQLIDSKRVDARCDVYALGAVLFECLCGRPPFQANNLARLIAQLQCDDAPDVRSLRGELSPALSQLVARCLAKTPRDRFANGQSLHTALCALQ